MAFAARKPGAALAGMLSLVALHAGCGGPLPAEAVDGRSPAVLAASPLPRPGPGTRMAAPAAASRPQAAGASRRSADAEPIDHAARTRAGLYVRRADAERIDRELHGQVIWLDATCCTDEEIELVAMLAYGEQAARNLGADAPLFVTGADQRLAARLVNRLWDAGLRTAYLVTR
jgi:hypothetical protein